MSIGLETAVDALRDHINDSIDAWVRATRNRMAAKPVAMSHTPGPWRLCGIPRMAFAAAIVANSETRPDSADDIEGYGGHLVCESVSRRNASLIVAAPDMFNLLARLADVEAIPVELRREITDTLVRAEGP